jgi:hypothetical protein
LKGLGYSTRSGFDNIKSDGEHPDLDQLFGESPATLDRRQPAHPAPMDNER